MYRKRIKNGIESWEHRNATRCDCCGKRRLVTIIDCDKYFYYNPFHDETICLDCKKNHPKFCPSCKCAQENEGNYCLNCGKPIIILRNKHAKHTLFSIYKENNQLDCTIIHCPSCNNSRNKFLEPGITRITCECGEKTFYNEDGAIITELRINYD